MKLLQRILTFFLLFCLAFSLVACSKKPAPTAPTETVTPTAAPGESDTTPAESIAPTGATEVSSVPTGANASSTVSSGIGSTPTRPTAATWPAKTQKPTITTNPAETTKTTQTTQPVETKQPAATTKPGQTAKPTAPVTGPTAASTPPKQIVHINTDNMTDLQKAVVLTAESYYLRGKYAQYDMSVMSAAKDTANFSNIGRRTTGLRAPEDYTSQFTGFTDCSGFVYDVYFFGLGMPIIDSNNRTTKAYCESTTHTILSETPMASGFYMMSAAELAAKEKAFTDTLQPGDIIVYRYGDDSGGHAMLYVGGGRILHSGGSSYDYKSSTEKNESEGTYRFDNVKDTLLSPGHKRYLFDKKVYVIMRPLNKFKGEIPAATLQRMELMRGVKAEKLSSHCYGQTVNPGDTMTFTFQLYNRSNVNKTLTVTDTLSKHTSYLSGADTVKGNTLSWTVSVPAGKIVEVSYSVKVNATAPTGEYIVSQSEVSGIAVNCPSVMIARTLSKDQQKAVTDSLAQLKSGKLRGIALINEAYNQACGKIAFAQQTTAALWENLVKTVGSDCALDQNQPLYNMMAPNLYGGRTLGERKGNVQAASENRARQITAMMLIPGDVIMAQDTLYVYTGDGLLNLATAQATPTTLLTTLLALDRFAVLRPSMSW